MRGPAAARRPRGAQERGRYLLHELGAAADVLRAGHTGRAAYCARFVEGWAALKVLIFKHELYFVVHNVEFLIVNYYVARLLCNIKHIQKD